MHYLEQAITLAQRLWLLERRPMRSAAVHSAYPDAHPYTSAFTVLEPSAVRVVFVRASELEATSEACLARPHLRWSIERSSRAFDTLDAALECAEAAKNGWLARGWTEVATDPRDR